MPIPLEKTDKAGNPYSRNHTVEAAIDVVVREDLGVLLRRAAVRNPESSDYLPSEVLVHLIRDGFRRNIPAVYNRLLMALFDRCEKILKVKVANSLPDAEGLREEVLGRLGELFAQDAATAGTELDYYEVRFNSAFEALRIDVVRAELTRLGHHCPFPGGGVDDEPASDDDALLKLPDVALLNPAGQENSVFRNQLLAAIRELPPDEREAVTLCHLMGYPVESEDPSKRTAATIARVSGRTIRNRLARAAAKLARFKE